MIIPRLKVLKLKDWKPDGQFLPPNSSQPIAIPANQKAVLLDEDGEVINATIVTPSPVSFKEGATINCKLVGNCMHNQFGWQIKVSISPNS